MQDEDLDADDGAVGVETSSGGSEVLRHSASDRGWTPPAQGLVGAAEAVEEHMKRHIGPAATVLHEIVSDLVHIDVHIIEPAPDRKFTVLYTTGMADLPMAVPKEYEGASRAELMIAWPPDWKLAQQDLEDENWYWPIRGLKVLARLPHEYATWLGHGHTVPNGDPPTPYAASVPFSCAMVTPPLLLPPKAHTASLSNGEKIEVLSVVWLHPGQVVLKLNKGAEALYERFDRDGVSELVDVARADVSKRRRFLGLFQRLGIRSASMRARG